MHEFLIEGRRWHQRGLMKASLATREGSIRIMVASADHGCTNNQFNQRWSRAGELQYRRHAAISFKEHGSIPARGFRNIARLEQALR
ncbi:hypothetical protein ACH79_36485 [Bradyrhizobium sp. CCBAU 051011]|nr:hypothetical protein ACH79_36485 [Bradyrhizobium sp. CCBAU 051011]